MNVLSIGNKTQQKRLFSHCSSAESGTLFDVPTGVCRGGSSLVALADAADADDEQKSSWVGGKAEESEELYVAYGLIHFHS